VSVRDVSFKCAHSWVLSDSEDPLLMTEEAMICAIESSFPFRGGLPIVYGASTGFEGFDLESCDVNMDRKDPIEETMSAGVWVSKVSEG
jgi:hypothetical protein